MDLHLRKKMSYNHIQTLNILDILFSKITMPCLRRSRLMIKFKKARKLLNFWMMIVKLTWWTVTMRTKKICRLKLIENRTNLRIIKIKKVHFLTPYWRKVNNFLKWVNTKLSKYNAIQVWILSIRYQKRMMDKLFNSNQFLRF